MWHNMFQNEDYLKTVRITHTSARQGLFSNRSKVVIIPRFPVGLCSWRDSWRALIAVNPPFSLNVAQTNISTAWS